MFSPTCILSLSPRVTGLRPSASIFSTAMSLVFPSVPTMAAGYSLPSCSFTVTVLPVDTASSTTWLLVRM